MSTKRIILIAGAFVLAAGAIGLGIWFRTKNGGSADISKNDAGRNGLPPVTIGGGETAPPTTVAQETRGLLVTGGRSFGVISDKETLDYIVDKNSDVLIAEKNGAVSKIVNGKAEVIYSPESQTPLSASFSHDGKKLLSSFGAPEQPEWGVFDIAKGEWTTLSGKVRSAAWSPLDYRIAYVVAAKNGGSTITVIDFGSRTPREEVLVSFSASTPLVSWATKDALLVSEPPTAFAKSSLWRIDIKKRTLAPILFDKAGAHGVWDQNNDRGLVFSAPETGGKNILSLIDNAGTIIKTTTLLTLPEKCAFYAPQEKSDDKKWIVCAIPRNASDFSFFTLPDDYYKKVFFSSDDVYAIGLDENAPLVVLFDDKSFSIDAHSLKIYGEVLFFINRRDGKLYAVSLAPALKKN